ncbi:MAG: type II toxin-antitoxin system PemK/MazF family toxin [Rubrobacteraceae bacterium]
MGTVVFVPFPFTDLSGRKRRPALVVSSGFDGEDVILCAITSRVPRTPSAWDVILEAHDMVEQKLPKKFQRSTASRVARPSRPDPCPGSERFSSDEPGRECCPV